MFFFSIIQSSQFLLTSIFVSAIVKMIILGSFISHSIKRDNIQKSTFFLLGTLFFSIFGDIAWFVKLIREIYISSIPYPIVVFFVRIAWACLVLQYQMLSLFVRSLAIKKFMLKFYDKVHVVLSLIFASYFLFLAFFKPYYLATQSSRSVISQIETPLEFIAMQLTAYYLLIVLMVPALYLIINELRKRKLPKIITQQLKIFTLFFILPYFGTEFLLAFCFKSVDSENLRPLVACSTIALIAAVTYCLKRVFSLRFLNFSDHVQAKPNIRVIDNFKTVLEQLSNAKSLHELSHITQTFFKEAFNTPLRSIRLILKDEPSIYSTIESFILHAEEPIKQFIDKRMVLSYDELSFDQFYKNNNYIDEIIQFLQKINADIFLPIYAKNKLIAGIIINRNAREHCFSKNECDTMLVFASYVSNMISLLEHKNVDQLVHKERQLQEEIYERHQEINQYKESINSFLRKNNQKEIGIIFHKNGNFTFGNQIAKKLIKININTQEGHPLTKALKMVAHQVESFKAPYTHIARDENGKMLILSGVPHLHNNHTIITIVYPDISDIIAQRIDKLDNPNDWDYVLYLESTYAGTQINQLVPGIEPMMLNFKINLLKAALSKRAILLDIPHDDMMPTVERLHHISLREGLNSLDIAHESAYHEIATKLFGINPLVPHAENLSAGLLKTNGTLFIKNIHLLDLNMQNKLADFIQYGYYHPYRSEQKEYSSARLICATNQHLAPLMQDGTFSYTLLTQLKPVIAMPSLSTICPKELFSLIDGYTDQAVRTHAFKNILELTPHEKERLIQIRPASLTELKTKVIQLLTKKSKESNLEPSVFDPAYEVSDPELIHAARLGKQALKDQKIMSLLWHKFKNQNKIAQFLGVNRSSVHRRFKMLNMLFDGKENIA